MSLAYDKRNAIYLCKDIRNVCLRAHNVRYGTRQGSIILPSPPPLRGGGERNQIRTHGREFKTYMEKDV